MEAERLGSGEAVGARRHATEALGEEGEYGLGPGRGVVATRGTGDPDAVLLACVGPEVSGGQGVEATARATELVGSRSGRQRAESKGFEDMPNEGGRMPVDELLVLFMSSGYTCLSCPPRPVFSSASLRSVSSKPGCGGKYSPPSSHERVGTCPALLTTKLVLL